MTQDQFDRLEAAHMEASKLPRAQREAFLHRQFPREPDLLDEARELLACSDQAGSFLDTPLISRFVEPDARDQIARAGRMN
jgi:hypothetical protein